MAKVKLESVIERAAMDAAFRGKLLGDASATLAAEKIELAADEKAMLDEYVRVAKSMTPAELEKAIAEYLAPASKGKRVAAGV